MCTCCAFVISQCVTAPFAVAVCDFQALAATSGSDPVAALDWLCLHVPEAEVTAAFAPRHTAGHAQAVGSEAAQPPKRKAFGRPFKPKSRDTARKPDASPHRLCVMSFVRLTVFYVSPLRVYRLFHGTLI